MSETSFQKIDKYYLALVLVLIVMAVMLVFSFRGVFSAFLNATNVNSLTSKGLVRINQTELDTAYNWAFNKNSRRLEVGLR